jgi:hypothetical protein
MRKIMLMTLALTVLTAAITLSVQARDGVPVTGKDTKGILPPNATAFGKSLADWLQAYWRWNSYGTNRTQPYQPGPGPMTFLPIPSGTQLSGSWTPEDPAYLQGQIELWLKPGTPFVFPLFSWVGEKYDPALGYPDDPMIPDDQIKTMVTSIDGTGGPEVTIDGETVLELSVWDFYVGATPFDPIVVYDTPSGYGSIAAHSFQSVGFIKTPLTPGTHTITLKEKWIMPAPDQGGVPGINPFGVIYDNTWVIHVAK